MPVVMTLTVMVPAPVPDVGVRFSHVELSDAVQLRVPLPEFEIERVLFAGLLPPCTAENNSDVALSPIVGVGAAVISSVTVTV